VLRRFLGSSLRGNSGPDSLSHSALRLRFFLGSSQGNPARLFGTSSWGADERNNLSLRKTFFILILLFFVLSGWLYFALLESSPWQGTIGKKLFGLYVADTQGDPPTFMRTSRRFLAGRFLVHVPYCGVLYFSLDCICAGLTPSKQSLHDLIAGCLVLRKNNGILLREESVPGSNRISRPADDLNP